MKIRVIILVLVNLYVGSALSSVRYYNNIFGNVVRNASNYSASLTTISCGHPVKTVQTKKTQARWTYVKVGAYRGYLPTRFLAQKKPSCFQDKYPRFFAKFELDLAEYYYWGKLYNQYVQGKSKVR